MPNRVDHTAMAAVGFVTPWSVRAGDDVSLHLSSEHPQPLVGVVRLDAELHSVGWQTPSLGAAVAPRSFARGSWLELPWNGVVDVATGWSLEVEFFLTRNAGPRTLIGGPGFRLDIDAQQQPVLCGAASLESRGASLETHVWYLATVDRASTQSLAVSIRRANSADIHARLSIEAAENVLDGCWTLGAARERGTPTLNAKIGRISLVADTRTPCWSFGPGSYATSLAAQNHAWPALLIHNGPTFAARSLRGADAVQLHEDDLGQCDWPATHRCRVPATADAGVYAFEVTTAAGTEYMPFFVRARRPSAALVFLVPTATYLAYSNEYLPADRYPWRCADRGHRFAQDNQLRSLYDVHADGSGVTLSTTRQPHVLLRPDYRYPLSNSPHLLPVDLQLLKFLRLRGIEVDLLTDHDLHAEGHAALEAYGAVFTGSHPEYWSSGMLTALDRHLERGGNLAYLGGNGFYLSVAFAGDRMELRRDPRDVIWGSEPGATSMALSGEEGGYWERCGRPPQSLVGSTFLMMGFGPSRPYRRLPASYSSDWSWVFDGVGERPIGDSGTVLGGAAGYEVDGVVDVEPALKSLVRLATADGFDDSFQVRAEVVAAHGGGCAHLRRADMTIYRHPGGGLVFSVGSVAWCGSLPSSLEDNAVGSILTNIARRFAAPTQRTTAA